MICNILLYFHRIIAFLFGEIIFTESCNRSNVGKTKTPTFCPIGAHVEETDHDSESHTTCPGTQWKEWFHPWKSIQMRGKGIPLQNSHLIFFIHREMWSRITWMYFWVCILFEHKNFLKVFATSLCPSSAQVNPTPTQEKHPLQTFVTVGGRNVPPHWIWKSSADSINN